jgi:hypothetical protein
MEDETSIADLVRECLAEAERQRGTTIPDGGSVRVPMHLRDGETLPELRARTSDAYQIFLADRAEYFRQRDAELAEIAKGNATPSYTAACEARDAAWQKRGEQQASAWQQKLNNAGSSGTRTPQPNAPLADAIAARDAAWAARGERQANAWRRDK